MPSMLFEATVGCANRNDGRYVQCTDTDLAKP